jgi:hypothetical protein
LLCYEQFKDPEDFVRQYAKALLVCAIKVLDGKAFPAPPHEVIRCFMTVRDKVLREGGVDLTQSAAKTRPASALESGLGEEVPVFPREPRDEAEASITDEDFPVMAATADAEDYPEETIDYDLFAFKAQEDHAVLTRYIGFDDASIVIPSRWNGLPVTVIGERAFAKALELRKVSLSKGIEIIEKGAFAECPELSVINLPDTLITIGAACFDGCQSLLEIIIPDSVNSIGKEAFAALDLHDITLGKGVKVIEEAAFKGCHKLCNISFPDSLEYIGQSCFKWCTSLTQTVIPESVKSMGEETFRGCTSLRKATLPKTLENLPRSAFADCSALESVDLPSPLKIVGPEAFRWCAALQKVELKEGLKAIGKEAFCYCTSLLEAHIPSSVDQLGGGVFANCPEVTVFCKAGSAIHMYCRENNVKCAKAR